MTNHVWNAILRMLVVLWLVCCLGNNAAAQEQRGLKVLSCIAAYRSLNNTYLVNTLIQYRDLCLSGYEVTVVVQTVDEWTDNQLSHLVTTLDYRCRVTLEFEFYPESVELALTEKHRATMARRFGEFDLFIYQEDDMALTLDHVNRFLATTDVIERYYEARNVDRSSEIPVVGFVRYEELDYPTSIYRPETGSASHPANSRYVFELPYSLFKMQCIGDEPMFWDFINPHQALWILTKPQLLRLQRDCNFFDQGSIELPVEQSKMVYMSTFSIYDADSRVLQATNLLGLPTCNVKKYIPLRDFCEFGIHHSRQKYAASAPDIAIDDILSLAIDYAKVAENRKTGNVPLCWQQVVDANLVKPFCWKAHKNTLP